MKFLWLAPLALLLAAPALAQGDPDPALVGQGQYVAVEGDCTACHTNPGGAAFAGGLGIASPIGVIYASNITPDKNTGIGNWSFDDFNKLMRKGITKQGYTVYPAMPFPSYSRISDADMHALYAYLMLGVQPVDQADEKPKIPWPLSIRWPMTVWRWAFAPAAGPFQPEPGQDANVARGAYLVQGLGHCGSCHTPREITLQEDALNDVGHPSYLSGGGHVDGWIPVDLRNDDTIGLGRWNADDIVSFLKTGSNAHAAVFGGMAAVVRDSTQYMKDDDLRDIALYLKSLPAASDAHYTYDNAETVALNSGDASKPGAQTYLAACDVCHASNGQGYAHSFPALAGNPVVLGDDPASLINIVLDGARRPATQSSPSALVMPTLGWKLNDQQIADVLTFIRSSWGNDASTVSADEVARLRKVAKPIPAAALSP
jgi:mono/diheme cytochrome c family protein